ncbi:hypothetical protein QBC35DRAFT_536047 [Podospora australis]|uniref:Uncharacterized protein n=1 Tax=Podospora australis TaxID=1536484 RepID=A0AAN6WMU1_9PEZI|nr:hypothetical protein QBC35DRAFT_536047 [Podospora australis]
MDGQPTYQFIPPSKIYLRQVLSSQAITLQDKHRVFGFIYIIYERMNQVDQPEMIRFEEFTGIIPFQTNDDIILTNAAYQWLITMYQMGELETGMASLRTIRPRILPILEGRANDQLGQTWQGLLRSSAEVTQAIYEYERGLQVANEEEEEEQSFARALHQAMANYDGIIDCKKQPDGTWAPRTGVVVEFVEKMSSLDIEVLAWRTIREAHQVHHKILKPTMWAKDFELSNFATLHQALRSYVRVVLAAVQNLSITAPKLRAVAAPTKLLEQKERNNKGNKKKGRLMRKGASLEQEDQEGRERQAEYEYDSVKCVSPFTTAVESIAPLKLRELLGSASLSLDQKLYLWAHVDHIYECFMRSPVPDKLRVQDLNMDFEVTTGSITHGVYLWMLTLQQLGELESGFSSLTTVRPSVVELAKARVKPELGQTFQALLRTSGEVDSAIRDYEAGFPPHDKDKKQNDFPAGFPEQQALAQILHNAMVNYDNIIDKAKQPGDEAKWAPRTWVVVRDVQAMSALDIEIQRDAHKVHRGTLKPTRWAKDFDLSSVNSFGERFLQMVKYFTQKEHNNYGNKKKGDLMRAESAMDAD